MPHLTPTEVDAFHRDGFLLPPRPVLPPAAFDHLVVHVDDLLERWERLTPHRPEALDKPHFFDPQLLDWVGHPAVLDLVEPLVGPDIALFSTHLICKPAERSQRVPWHADSTYWSGQLDPVEVVTLWLALDPSTVENGCMQVIPGSHRTGQRRYEPLEDGDESLFAKELASDEFDAAMAIDCVLAPNHGSLHHADCIHGSAANRGRQRRCGLTMRFMSTRVTFTPVENQYQAGHRLTLMRGVDHGRCCSGDPTRPNEAYLAHRTDLRAIADSYREARA